MNIRAMERLVAFAPTAFVIAAGCGVEAQTMSGTYAVATPNGTVTMSVTVSSSGEAVGWLRDSSGNVWEMEGAESVDEEGDLTVEGVLLGLTDAEFTLFGEDDGTFGLVLVSYDETGMPHDPMVHVATRTSELPASSPDSDDAAQAPSPGGQTEHSTGRPPPSEVSRDPRFVGTWSTQVVMNSSVGSVAVQMLMAFTPEGILRDLGSRGMGGVGDGSVDTGLGLGGEEALWRTQGDLLFVSLAGSQWVPLARYGFSDGRLLLVYVQDGSRQIWSRQ